MTAISPPGISHLNMGANSFERRKLGTSLLGNQEKYPVEVSFIVPTDLLRETLVLRTLPPLLLRDGFRRKAALASVAGVKLLSEIGIPEKRKVMIPQTIPSEEPPVKAPDRLPGKVPAEVE